MDSRQDVMSVGEPPPPYCENEGYGQNPCPSTFEDTAFNHYPPGDQSSHSAYYLRQQELMLQEDPYQRHVNPCLQCGQQAGCSSPFSSSVAYCHSCFDRRYPEDVARGHPSYPLQLRLPIAVVSNQPPLCIPTSIQNQNTSDTEVLLDREDPIDKHIFAWVACLLCCWPIGIPAVITSQKARNANKRGEYQLSYRYSKLSGKLSWCAIIVGFFFYLATIVITLCVLRRRLS